MFFSQSEVWGHRGWPSRHPDNTVAGIRAAATVAAGVEIDVRRSADGRLVLSHDPDLAGLVVAHTEWRELAGVDLGGHRPALLDEVLDVTATLNIEIKNDPTQPDFDAEHHIVYQVMEHARAGDLVSSFWWPSVDAARAVRPEIRTGLLLYGPIDPASAVQHAVDRGHPTVVPHHDQIDEGLMALAEREGITVVAWTVDDAQEALRLADLGVAAIITNRPGELIAEEANARKSR